MKSNRSLPTKAQVMNELFSAPRNFRATIRVRLLIGCAFVTGLLPVNSQAAETVLETNRADVVGYAWPRKDLLIPVPNGTKFRWLRSGEPYPIIGQVDSGYLMLVETIDGRKLPALVPFRDRMGSYTQNGNYAGIEETKAGFFPLKAGTKYPVISQNPDKYTIKYTSQGCDEVIKVAAIDVEFQSLGDYKRSLQEVLRSLQAQAEIREKQGDYAGARKLLESYNGRLSQETAAERQQLIDEGEGRRAKAEAENETRRQAELDRYEASQKEKGLVKYNGDWLTAEEARSRDAATEQNRREAEMRETLRKAERGVLGGLALDYDFILTKNLPVVGVVQEDAGGHVELLVSGEDKSELYVWSRNSPVNRNKEWVQFPFSGFISLREDDVPQFEELVRKFVEWEKRASQEGLKDISKDIGELAGFSYRYTRSSQGQGWLTIAPNSNDLRQIKEILRKTVTLFPPAADASLKLISVRHALHQSKKESEAETERAQRKANDLLK